jgi:hypothetical protein
MRRTALGRRLVHPKARRSQRDQVSKKDFALRGYSQALRAFASSREPKFNELAAHRVGKS